MKTRILLMITSVFLTCSVSAQENKASVVLTTAIYEEEVTGNLDKAVELYLDILKKYPDDRPVAAKALYHLGLVNEKMGKQKATEYFTRLVNTYPDQIEMVALAKTKLAALDTTTAARSTGITIRQVWAGPGVDTYGAPSPDGRYISYVDWERSDINHNDLAIYEIATGKKRRLTNNASWDEPGEYQCAYYSRWSPDGKQIVYVWYNGEGYYELRIIGIDGSKPRILFRNEEVEWARTYDWSPDGKQILACFDKKDGSDQMVLVSVADGSVCVLKILEQGWPNNMTFSPDGRYIMYDYPQKDNSVERDINLLLIDESREIPLVEHPADDFVLGWAPDGKNILFASDRTGTLGTWLIAVADGKPKGAPELVNPDIGRFIPLGFTQKGSFYYGISKGKDDVYIAELNTKTGKILSPPNKTVTRSEGFNIASEYSPDGKYLAYIYNLGFLSHNRNRHHILCIRNLETGEDSEFSLNLNYIIRQCSPRWSPDCRSILVLGSNNWNLNRYGIYKIDIQTGEVTCILQNSNSGVWSNDGKSIFYLRGDSKAKISQIFVRDLETGKEKELYQSASNDYIPFNISLSPDGQSLALRCLRPTSLKVMPTTGGEPQEFPEFDKVATIHKPIAWTADGRYIIFSGKNPGGEGHPLYRISVESGKIDRLGLNISRYHSLSVHPDGIHIAISCWGPTPKSDEVWVMENFLTETKAEH